MHGPDSIDLQKVLAGRKERESFHWFLDEIAPVVVGANLYDQMKCVKLPSEWLTPTLEAFGLLCVENSFERIRSIVLEEDRKAPSKWTSDGRGAKKNQGWHQDGISRYNDLVDEVRRDRASFPKEDEQYLASKVEERLRFESERLQSMQEAASDETDIGPLLTKDDLSDTD